MHIAEVEIFSDATNAVVMRHPGRHFPGVLVQGDTLSNLCKAADEACAGLSPSTEAFAAANDLRSHLWDLLNHYKIVLDTHGLPLPFAD